MGFLKKNKFESDWGMTMLHTPQDIGVARSFDNPLEMMGESIIAAGTGAAQFAFDDGFAPDDAILVGKTYLIALLAQKYPTLVKPQALTPSLDDVMRVLQSKYGTERVFKIRAVTASFIAHLGLSLHPRSEPEPQTEEAPSLSSSASPMTTTENQEPELLDVDELELIRPWLKELRDTGEIVKGLALSGADAKALSGYTHVPRSRRSAEMALYLMWWAETFVWERIADVAKRELAGEVLRSLISEEFPDMDLIGQQRYEEIAKLHDDGASTLELAAIPLRGMDADVTADDAAATVASYQSMMLKRLGSVWQKERPLR